MNDWTKTKPRCVLRGSEPYASPQGAVYAPGVSAQTAGSKTLFLGIVTLPAGQRTKAHVHERHESAMHMLSGENVELWWGEQLENHETAFPGDYLFIPAGMPHVAVNRSASQPAIFVGARNEATAEESLHLRPDLDGKVPA
ncbi:MAG: cupin domain-containing protein [Burkholderiaceae bacterium]|jgi:uncharacterized RmlC-like cupin family protein|nr:cupin domain-containing protein [Burkholderiaceae bacterium]